MVQLVLCVLVHLIGKYLNRAPTLSQDFRERLDQKLIVSGRERKSVRACENESEKEKMMRSSLPPVEREAPYLQ